jgi:autophagy-related protein 5
MVCPSFFPFSALIPKDVHDNIPDGADNRHWPIDLIHLHSIISRPIPSSSSSSSTAPLKLRLHLTNPPHEKLNLPNNPEQCRTQWVNQIKEADFVRWRNTSRSTGLRRGEFDAGWDGIVNGKSASPIGRNCAARKPKWERALVR